MKCDECGKSNAEWQCPECGCYACQACFDGMEGRCDYCAPQFQNIKEHKKYKAPKAEIKFSD